MSNVLPPLEPAVRSYIAAFDLFAVAEFRDGTVTVTRNPAGAVSAYWCEGKREAGFIVKLAQEGRMSLPDAAQRLHLRIGPHAAVVAKATASVEKLNNALIKAHGDGAMRLFNRLYREQREAARAGGRGYMSYTQARAKLTRELFKVAAGEASVGLIARVLTER